MFWGVSAAVEFLFSVIYLRNLGHYELKFDHSLGLDRLVGDMHRAACILHSLTEGADYAE